MKEYANKSFNIERLLTLGDLDIRGIAMENATLTADGYFSRVEKFVENAPQYADALVHASNPKEWEDINNVLAEIGYNKLTSDIDGVCDAIIAGKHALTEKWAADISGRLNTLYDRVKSAYMKKRFRAAQIADNMEASDDGVLLAEALEYFDYKEANRKLRILAVDDVAVVLNTLTSVLSRHYEVFALTKASQVEDFLKHTTPELFLLDIEMPEMDGYDLIRVIRQFDEHKDTPIIFLTGNASVENVKNAVALGACDFITKPINPNILLEKIESKIVWKKTF